MKECNDKRFENLLEAYELDMLAENEKLSFEEHLYECEYCFNRVKEFEKAAFHIRKNPDVKKAIQGISEQRPETEEPESKRKRFFTVFGSKWKSIISTSAVAIIILIILILKPWDIQIRPDLSAYAENRLTIMYFENIADPGDSLKLEQIITNLLITDFSESQYIQVLSGQRLNDIIRMLNFEDPGLAGRDIMWEVAKKAKSKWIVTGNILQTTPRIELSSQLIEVSSGNSVASQRVSGEPGDDIFRLVDKLSEQIRSDFLTLFDISDEADHLITDITTNSPIAYRYYLEGIDYYNKFYNDKAIASFEKALVYDSTFAMAYYYLANLKNTDLIYRALEYANHAGQKDRFYIKVFESSLSGNYTRTKELLNEMIERYPDEKYAHFLLASLEYNNGNYRDAVKSLNKAVELDPLYKMAYNQMVYAYSAIDDFEKALWAIDKYIAIAPDEANPYDTKADLYAVNGMIDNALETYQTALKIKPDYYPSLSKLGLMHLYKNEFEKADSCFKILIEFGNESFQRQAEFFLLYIQTRTGKFKNALEVLADYSRECQKNCYNYHFIKSQIYWELGDWERAISEMDTTVQVYSSEFPDDRTSYRYMFAQVLAEGGNIDMALELSKQLKDFDKTNDLLYYHYALGTVEMARHNYYQASEHFSIVEKGDARFFIRYMLAKSYLHSGQTDKAIEVFEKIVREYSASRAYFVMWSVDVHYYLGLTYEDAGHLDKAADQYRMFLNLWGEADFKLEQIDDARMRLTQIENRS